MGEEFFGAEGLVAYFFYSFEVLGEVAFVFAEVGFYLFDQLVEEHFHDGKVIFELLHDFIPDIVVDEQFVLFLAEGFGVDFSLLESDVGFVGDHALPLREDEDEDFCFVEGDVEFVEGEAVVDFEGEVVQKYGFVAFEQEPVLYLADRLFFVLRLLVLLGD